ncbi:hypothetical protein DERF_010454 [Dermatophagoides farinae]|uniref:Uncharacterized protein n=1 Tax=Dermatophagoides farinae TaxID=6954 RepID=A0A922HW60_DERFA|nr:hypothetical protein DERF_010454 [Dermatophagoides farinae]
MIKEKKFYTPFVHEYSLLQTHKYTQFTPLMRIKIFDYNIQQHHHHVLIVCSESLFDAYTFHIYDGSLLHNLNIFIILWICLLFFGRVSGSQN